MRLGALGRAQALRSLAPLPIRPAASSPARAAPRRARWLLRAQAPPDGGGAGAGAFPSGDSPSGDLGAFAEPVQPSAGDRRAAKRSGGGLLGPLKVALKAYDRAVKARPVTTKALTSFVGFALGDRIAQSVGGAAYDPYRAARLSLYGLLIDGPVGHAWYALLDKHVCPAAPTSNKAVLIKTALDQLVWGPAMTLVFFAFLKVLEGRPDLILLTIQAKFWPTMMANYVLWPLAHLINFKYVPADWRIAFNNAVALLWTTYLSMLCGGPGMGGGAHAPGVDGAAMAASAVMSVFPCSKAAGALAHPELAAAARQVAATETILTHWGSKAFSSAEQVGAYLQLKAEVMQRVCSPPIRLPPR